MTSLDAAQTVVVLDLDDTLYQEADYHASGMREVCKYVERLYGKSIASELALRGMRGEKDLLGSAARLLNMPQTVKVSLLWIYRLHLPLIILSDAAKAAVEQLEKQCRALLILTDGRSVSQRQKLKALGLSHLPVYISEEYASEKPEVARFARVMTDFPAEAYVYVGDNPQKDFVAPNALGWTTVGIRGNGRNLHAQDCDGLSPESLPHRWINGLSELPGHVGLVS